MEEIKMGFFSELKNDLSQAVNTLMPDDRNNTATLDKDKAEGKFGDKPEKVYIDSMLNRLDDIKLEDNLILDLEDNANLGVEITDYVEAIEEEEVEEEAIPFQLVEEKPTFQGGDANEFSKWVNAHLSYPEVAKENGVQGRVTLQFTVNPDGSVSNVKVLRGVDSSLDKEAVRVVSSSPKWKPGRQRDRAVKVTYTFPVIFQLR